MSTSDFYQDLPAFEGFIGIARSEHYVAAPADWQIVITDVIRSTEAIQSGRYKDVNTVGAAAIVAAHNVMGAQEFPYVFGGDGATFLLPPSVIPQLGKALAGLQTLAREQFGLGLRVGCASVADVTRTGARVEVAKMSLTGNRSVAVFRGGGLSLADRMIKADPDGCRIEGSDASESDFNRLSCRWRPIPARRGRVLSLIVAPVQADDYAAIQAVIEVLQRIYQGRLDTANPVNLPEMSYSTVRECLRNEKRLHQRLWSRAFLARFAEILIAVWAFRLNLPPLLFDPENYTHSLAAHSDYRKYDDLLRMTIDCSPEQSRDIRDALQTLHTQGRILFGLHESTHSLMTCFVDGLGEGRHIHFIDAENGGYFLASKGFKAQLKARDQESAQQSA